MGMDIFVIWDHGRELIKHANRIIGESLKKLFTRCGEDREVTRGG